VEEVEVEEAELNLRACVEAGEAAEAAAKAIIEDDVGAEDEFKEKREGRERLLVIRGPRSPIPGTARCWLLWLLLLELEMVEAGTMNGDGDIVVEREDRFDFINVLRAFIPLP
jgi:hypothetical protein